MRIAHVLRKYNPQEWGGTETALLHLLERLGSRGVESVIYCPSTAGWRKGTAIEGDPLKRAGCTIRRFQAFMPVWGISRAQRRQLTAVGGNIMSWDAFFRLTCERDVSVIHTHTLLRLGALALWAARVRRIPLVVTVHGGVADLPAATRASLLAPLKGGVEWGKAFGVLVGSRRLLARADAVIAVNGREAQLLSENYPHQRVARIPHGIVSADFEPDARGAAWEAWPRLRGRRFLLSVGRIDEAKNQLWLIEQMRPIVEQFPDVRLVLAGPIVDAAYGRKIHSTLRTLGLEEHVLMTGLLPPADPRLRGLLQTAEALVLPSVSETFGLVLLESWAAGRPVIATRTHGALDLVKHGDNGWLFDLDEPGGFHRAVREALDNPTRARAMGAEGCALVRQEYDSAAVAARVQRLYGELVEKRQKASS